MKKVQRHRFFYGQNTQPGLNEESLILDFIEVLVEEFVDEFKRPDGSSPIDTDVVEYRETLHQKILNNPLARNEIMQTYVATKIEKERERFQKDFQYLKNRTIAKQ